VQRVRAEQRQARARAAMRAERGEERGTRHLALRAQALRSSAEPNHRLGLLLAQRRRRLAAAAGREVDVERPLAQARELGHDRRRTRAVRCIDGDRNERASWSHEGRWPVAHRLAIRAHEAQRIVC
jgi:hypothetical protein